jgi:GNAT superfamily N-acetyltransferase
MIVEFAEFEKLSHVVSVSEESLLRDGFGPDPKFRVLIAEWDGEVTGYAFFFEIYSTFQGKHGMFLEDIYVRERFRGKEIGKALLAAVAAIALKEECYGLRWEVLDWNQPAIDFYQKLGAVFLDDWKNMLLSGDALNSLAENSK